jgi:UDP-N-acetylmuramoyl-tripeptide--D-alanyl-D-alanine ligase
LLGAYNFSNIQVALAIGNFFGVNPEDMHSAIAAYVPENNRSQIIQKGDLTLILDAYNANPSSMEAALDNLAQMNGQPKYVILGDMFELGDDSEKEHRKIGQLLSELKPEVAWVVGKDMRFAKESCPDVRYFEDKEALSAELKNTFPQKGLLLIKGSRSMGLESLLN